MHTTKYLIIGAGMTGDMAAKGIREHDSDGSITMMGADPNPPYKRPLLTKGLWKGSPEEKLWREPAEGVELVTGRRIVSLDLAAHTATSDEGEECRWEKLLLATGAKPREIPGAAGVIWYRTLDDYHRLREVAPEGAHVVVIGGGFIGSEIAAGLVGNGVRVTMLFPEPGIGFRLFPLGLSEFVADYYREKGVEVHAGELVASASGERVEAESGLTFEADAVVAGLAGAEPEGRRHVRRGRQAAWRAPLERVGQARCRPRRDPLGRGCPCGLAPSTGRGSRGAGRSSYARRSSGRSRIRSSSSSRA